MDNHQSTHTNCKITNTAKILENEKLHVIILLKQTAIICAELINQKDLKNRTIFSARFDKPDEDDQP